MKLSDTTELYKALESLKVLLKDATFDLEEHDVNMYHQLLFLKIEGFLWHFAKFCVNHLSNSKKLHIKKNTVNSRAL